MKKILIVDDEPMMLMLAKKILAAEYNVICAASAAEAIALYAAEKPDMILSDLLMPQMNGFEMHKALESTHGINIPIIFMTADESCDIGDNDGPGAAELIRKPFPPDMLLKKVANIINNI